MEMSLKYHTSIIPIILISQVIMLATRQQNNYIVVLLVTITRIIRILYSNNLQFRQSMVPTVYIDQRIRDSRDATSFIISGLPTSTVHSDKYIVSEMCTNEFKVHVDIVSTKRLGKASSSSLPSSATRIQPLLVNVRNTEHASLIISSARQLRQSVSPFVRDNIFINPNLTQAEAHTAYELRCRRWTSRGSQPSLSIAATLPAVSNAELNATVPAFKPTKPYQPAIDRPSSSLQSSVPNDSVI